LFEPDVSYPVIVMKYAMTIKVCGKRAKGQTSQWQACHSGIAGEKS
jgi:hypothetical protein